MIAHRLVRLPLLAGALFAVRVASAACPVTSACNDASVFLGTPACCGAHSCVLDGTVTMSGAVCNLDFDGRDLTIAGAVNVGSSTLHLSAASVVVSGLVNAKGTGQSPGGNILLTTRGGAPTAVRLASGGSGLRIDISGSGRGAGMLDIRADGNVELAGRIVGTSSAAAGDGGTVFVSTPGSIALTASLVANGGDFGNGGTIELSAGGTISLLTNAKITANGGDGGSVSLDAIGAVTLDPPSGIETNGSSSNAGFGGSVDITAANATLNGVIEARGGGDPAGDSGGDGGEVDIDVSTGALILSRSSSAIVVEGAGGGSAGIVSLLTNSPTNGVITIDAAISAGGRGGSKERPGGGGEISIDSAQGLEVNKIIDAHGTGAGTGEVELSAARDITLTNNLLADDPSLGGSLSAEAGHDVIVNADLRAKATSDGAGGTVTLSGGRDVIIKKNADIDASAAGTNRGGDVGIDAGRDITVEKDGSVRVNGGGTAAGGTIDLYAGFFELAGNLTLDGDILARGASAIAADSASIVLRGCQVSIGGTVDSTGDAGSLNSVTARSGITLTGAGAVKTTATGNNTLLYPTGSLPNFGNKVSPPFSAVASPVCTAANVPANCLVPCPNCGDGTVQFPEQCEPSVAGCAQCSTRCRTRTCDDTRPCTTDTCDNEFGCINENKPDGVTCTDNNGCTVDEQCNEGACIGPVFCDDGNQCTDDSCGPQGCIHSPKDCNDHDPCTLGDSCNPQTGCTHTGLKPCPAGRVCNAADGNCIAKSCENAITCDDHNPCTSDTCVGGVCVITPVGNGTECDNDTNRCNGVATCQNGACIDKAPCVRDDGDVCTEDVCTHDVGCTNTHIPGCCNEVSDCTPVTVCTTCVNNECGTELGCCTTDSDCDDGNPCTDDGHCDTDNNRCPAPTPVSGRDCGTLCAPAACVAGQCEAGAPVTCPDDGDLCTDDFCDPTTGLCTTAPIEGCCLGGTPGECGDICTFCDTEANRCASEPDCVACERDTDCDPLGRCTGAACGLDGKCTTVEPANCDDGVAGTRDVCTVDGNGAPLCQHQCLNAAACDDHDLCNGVETCNAGTCVPGAPLDCDDGNACTSNDCDPARGCVPTDARDFASVGCELDNISAALATASPTDIQARVLANIQRPLAKARTKLDAAEAAGAGKKAQKALAVVKAQAKKIRRVVKKAVRKRKVAPALADLLLGASDGASKAAQTLRASLRT
jgi:Dictyostelium (slime mold) repeat